MEAGAALANLCWALPPPIGTRWGVEDTAVEMTAIATAPTMVRYLTAPSPGGRATREPPYRRPHRATQARMLISAGLGLHHSGVEQHWWAGPTECTSGSSGATTIDELRAMMLRAKVVQCDQIAWTLFGISMATYNFLVSLAAGIGLLVLTSRGRNVR